MCPLWICQLTCLCPYSISRLPSEGFLIPFFVDKHALLDCRKRVHKQLVLIVVTPCLSNHILEVDDRRHGLHQNLFARKNIRFDENVPTQNEPPKSTLEIFLYVFLRWTEIVFHFCWSTPKLYRWILPISGRCCQPNNATTAVIFHWIQTWIQ